MDGCFGMWTNTEDEAEGGPRVGRVSINPEIDPAVPTRTLRLNVESAEIVLIFDGVERGILRAREISFQA